MPPTPSALGAPSANQLTRNPFRLLGLAPDCTGVTVRKTADRALAVARLGAAPMPAGPFPPAAPPGDDAVRRAAHELRDPAARLLAELFWFEADPGRGTAHWTIDGSMPISQLEDVWNVATGPRPEYDPTSSWQVRGPAAARNLAVLALLQLADAADDESALSTSTAWRDAPAWWSVWSAADTTPVKVLARARELGVAAADLDADGVRRALTRAFLTPYLELVTRATGHGRDVSGHVARGLASGGLDAAEVRSALAGLADTAAQRIDTDVEQSWSAVQADPSTEHAVGARLRRELTPWVELMRTADAPGRPLHACSTTVRRRADQFGDMLLACAVNHLDADDANGVSRAEQLVVHARAYVTGEELTTTVEGTLAGLRSAAAQHRRQAATTRPAPAGSRPDPHACLLCGKEAGFENVWLRATFHRSLLDASDEAEVRRAGLDPSEPFHGRLPRCAPCATAQRTARGRLGQVPVLVGLGLGALWGGAAGGVALFVVLAVLALLWAAALVVMAATLRRRQREAVAAHPVTAELSRLGYGPPTLEGA